MFIKKYISLFFLCFIICNNLSCEEKTRFTNEINSKVRTIDSVYNIAKNKKFSDSVRNRNVNLFYSMSFNQDQDSIIYKALMLKTSLHYKSKEKDSALLYSLKIIALGEKYSNYGYLISGYKKASNYSYNLKEYDSSIKYSRKLLTVAEEKKDSTRMALAYSKLGKYLKKVNKFEESFEFYTKSFSTYKKIGDTIKAGKSLLEMSKIQKSLGDFIGSKETAIEALKNLEKSDENISVLSVYQTISTAFREEGNFSEAINFNNKALAVSERIKDVKNIKNTRANILSDKGEFDQAISILNDLKITYQPKDTSNSYARIIDNLGFVLWEKDSLNKISKNLLLEAYDIRIKNADYSGLIASNFHLAKFYYLEPNKALFYAKNALKNAELTNSQYSQIEALSYIIDLKDNPKQEALSYTEIDENLKKINNQNRGLYAVSKFQNEELAKRNLKIEAENEKKQKLNSWYLFGLITVLLSLLLIVIILKNRHTKAQQEKVLETEKRISKRIHDELANDVYSSMVQLENNTVSVSEVVNNLEDIYHKARDLSQEKSTIRSNKEFIDDLKKSLASFKTEDTNVIVQGLIADIWIDISNEKKLIVDRVIKELLVNMRKHSSANIVSVIFSRKNNIMKIGYTDNGVGTYKNEISKGVGLVNAENRIEAIGGSFIFDKSIANGFKISIEIPV